MGNSERSMQTASMKEKIESVKRAFVLSPQNAQITLSGRCRLEDGLPATYEEGGFRYEMDVPSELGGMNAAPTAGKYLRGALAGCIAYTLKFEAALRDVDVGPITVDVEADCDERGDFGLDDVPPGYQQFRVSIEVQSGAPGKLVQDIIDRSLAQSPVFAALRHAQDVVLDTRIVP